MKVIFVKVVNRKIELHTNAGILTGPLMNQLEQLLSKYGFEKIDQNKLVNMNETDSFDLSEMKIKMKNGESCFVSRRNKSKIRRYFDKM